MSSKRDYSAEVKRRKIRANNRCVDCGILICPKPTYKRCIKCAHIEMERNGTQKRMSDSIRGDKHYLWNGGTTHDSNGYILRMRHGHPRANLSGYVLEHIIVWEDTNDKPLPKGWHIHHLNGVKSDNRTSNLVAMPSRKHYLVLQAKAKRIQELESLLRQQGQLL